MKRYKIVCQYDGSNFYGWQSQKDKRTVQGDLQLAITKLNKGKLVQIIDLGGQILEFMHWDRLHILI